MDDIPITKPFLPPREELDEIINGIYSREWLTNDGPILKKLEKNIAFHQNVSDCAIVCNGTMALQIGIRTLGLKGAILTTPFTYIATASSLAWEGCKPIFVDLNRGEFNVSCEQLAQAYTKEVRGIVLTHCFGLPLDVKGIAQLAKDWDIPVLYDASHAFGTTVNGRSIFEFGDVSTCSFHATKLFHMVEGGGIFSNQNSHLKQSRLLRNFGHNGPGQYCGIGINGKNSEFHAAMGLVNLRHFAEIQKLRIIQCETYFELLHGVRMLTLPPKVEGWNGAYFPILFKDEKTLLQVVSELNDFKIYPRRYFYPSLTSLDIWDGDCPNACDTASRVLCLPLYHDLSRESQFKIASIIKDKLNGTI